MTEWLFNTTLYTGLLIGVVLLLRRPVAQAFGPQIAYALWALPLLRLVLPPIVLPASMAPEAEPILAAPVMLTAAAPAALDRPALPAAEPILALTWAEILVPLWLGGALAFLAWRIVTYRRMRREVLAELRPVGEVHSIRLVETPAVTAPVAFGVIDKVVALPPLFMAQRDRSARDLAIAHELAHHRGNDLLANFAAQSVLALHWFNPLAWLGWRAMRRDQEAACDARVVAGQGREERARYAALIAGIAAGPRLTLAAPMACPVLGEASIIHRLRSLSARELPARRRWLGRALLGAGVVALPLTASVSYAAQAQEGSELTLPPPLAPFAPPESLEAIEPPAPPVPPAPPEIRTFRDENGREVRMVRVQRRGVQPGTQTRRFEQRRPGAAIGDSAEHMNFDFNFDFDEEAFEREMERFEAQVERHAELAARHAEREADRAEREAERATREHARMQTRIMRHAADAEASADSFLLNCTGSNPGNAEERAELASRCEMRITAQTADALQSARDSIADQHEMPDEIRREVLEELDREIARMRERF